MAETHIADTLLPQEKPRPALKLRFLCLEIVQTSPISLLIRLGGPNTIAVVYSKQAHEMNLLNHNGLDVSSREEVDEAHRIVCADADKWRLKKITKPHLQHGTYSFFFWERCRWMCGSPLSRM